MFLFQSMPCLHHFLNCLLKEQLPLVIPILHSYYSLPQITLLEAHMTVRSSAFTSFSYLLAFADSHSSTQYFVTYELFLWNTSCFYLLNLQSLSQQIPSHITPQFSQPSKYWVSISTYNMYLSSEGEVENSSFLQNLCKLMLNWYLKHKSKTNKSQSLQLILQVPHQ